MDPERNPYTPGAGLPPPELVGRAKLLSSFDVFARRLCNGRVGQSMVVTGLRGVGKTVLLNAFENIARAAGALTVFHEAAEDESFIRKVAVLLDELLKEISFREALKAKAKHALQILAAFRAEWDGVSFGVDLSQKREQLDVDLTRVCVTVGEALVDHGETAIVCIDEVQYLNEIELGALVAALHRCGQKNLPIAVVAAGLPLIHGRLGKAKSYAERLFTFPHLDRLDHGDAALAIRKPAEDEGVEVDADAIEVIWRFSEGYPYFLQTYGKHVWNIATAPVIRRSDAIATEALVLEELDQGFFKVRMDRVTDAERDYVVAMARVVAAEDARRHRPGDTMSVRSSDIAEMMGRKITSVGPIRSVLIGKGLLYSPQHGYTSFTVPQFDRYILRSFA